MSSLSYFKIIVVISDETGIIKNDAIPLKIILVNSLANIFEFIIALKLYWKSWKYINKGIDDPRKAKNNVLAVVPNISFPMFIPDINKSCGFSFLLFSCNSYNAEDIAIAVSFIVPIRPIIIIEFDKGNILIPTL